MDKIIERMLCSKKYGYEYKEPQGVAIINNFMNQPEYKSEIAIGNNIHVYVDKHFNWFHRFMIRLCFGFRVRNLKG